MIVYFRDRNPDLVFKFRIWNDSMNWAGLDVEFDIDPGDPLTVKADAVVSPANSFGFMNGGIDQHYTDTFGPGLQEGLQRAIQAKDGELLVGQAIAYKTGSELIPQCICAPTMRVPAVITDPIDVFLATRAAMRIAKSFNWNVIFPGMGTGVGNVEYAAAAKAMNYGIHRALQPLAFPISMRQAWERSRALEG